MKKRGVGFIPLAVVLITTIVSLSLISWGHAINPAMATTPAPASPGVFFTDIGESDHIYPYAVYLNHKDIMKGFPDGAFHGEQNLTRAQMAVLIYKAKNLSPVQPAGSTFNDLGPDHWAYPYITTMVQNGILAGYPDGSFRPEDPVTRAQCAALLLRLTSSTLNGAFLPGEIQDVDPSFWACQPVAASLNSGIMEPVDPSHFEPDSPATRAQVARSLVLVLNLAPDLRKAAFLATLERLHGTVDLQTGREGTKRIATSLPCPAGSIIQTGNDGEARLDFPDGSSILLKENTKLEIIKAGGQSYIKRDGSVGIMIDGLEIKLDQGRIFGCMAQDYFYPRTQPTSNGMSAQLTSNSKAHSQDIRLEQGRSRTTLYQPEVRLCSTRMAGLIDKNQIKPDSLVTGRMLTALADELVESGDAYYEGELPWWEEAYESRERLTVDMPWGVAGIRGTIWSNSASSSINTASVLDGRVEVRANGKRVYVFNPDNYTEIKGPNQDPQAPCPMPLQERQEWSLVGSWLTDILSAIQQNAPLNMRSASGAGGASFLPVPSTPGQLQEIIISIIDSYNKLSGKAVPSTSTAQWTVIGALDLDFHYIASDQDGNIYSSEPSNNLVDKFDAGGNLIAHWGGYGNGDGQFDIPQGVAVDSSGKVYVVDQGNNRIEVFNNSGVFMGKWGGGKLNSPTGLAVDAEGDVYVVNQNGSRIEKFDNSGVFVTEWGSGQFQNIRGIAVDTAGMVYVSDAGSNRILKYDSNGNFLSQWGAAGSSQGQLNTPEGIALDTDGNVYVADAGNRRVQEFDSNGGFIAAWDFTSQTSDGHFEYPQGLAIDPWNNIFVVGGSSL
ncbi:MAG: S-layer homology domain-containing protein [Syntrophomonadaceae bacterium]